MYLLVWVLVGLGAGWLAQRLLNDDWHKATAGNLVVGVLGAVVVAGIVRATGVVGTSGLNVWVLVAALTGAAATLYAGRALTSAPTLH